MPDKRTDIPDMETRLHHHLRYDQYPPAPVSAVPFLMEAIEAVGKAWIVGNSGDTDEVIKCPKGEVKAVDLVESYRLDFFVEEYVYTETGVDITKF